MLGPARWSSVQASGYSPYFRVTSKAGLSDEARLSSSYVSALLPVQLRTFGSVIFGEFQEREPPCAA
jgi:hypothetical protein